MTAQAVLPKNWLHIPGEIDLLCGCHICGCVGRRRFLGVQTRGRQQARENNAKNAAEASDAVGGDKRQALGHANVPLRRSRLWQFRQARALWFVNAMFQGKAACI